MPPGSWRGDDDGLDAELPGAPSAPLPSASAVAGAMSDPTPSTPAIAAAAVIFLIFILSPLFVVAQPGLAGRTSQSIPKKNRLLSAGGAALGAMAMLVAA